jgi:hypothetical protein
MKASCLPSSRYLRCTRPFQHHEQTENCNVQVSMRGSGEGTWRGGSCWAGGWRRICVHSFRDTPLKDDRRSKGNIADHCWTGDIISILNIAVHWMALLRNLEVPGSSLCPETGCSIKGFQVFFFYVKTSLKLFQYRCRQS